MSNSNESITRRDILGRALGTAALAAAIGSESQSQAQGFAAAPRRDAFDFGWKFTRGDAPGAQQPAFADTSWRSLDLPHDWSIEGPFSQDEPSGGAGAYAPTGIGWYRKRFTVPASYKGKKVSIEFDGVFRNSEVWINGHYLGKRPFGYISFAYDITPYLDWTGENVAAVKVDNSRQPGSRYYSGSGIYRHTWLTAVNSTHVAQWGTYVTTPRVSKETAAVYAKTRVRNENSAGAACTLASAIVDRDGKVVQTARSVPANRRRRRIRVRAGVSGGETEPVEREGAVSLHAAQHGSRRAGSGGCIRNALRDQGGSFRRG